MFCIGEGEVPAMPEETMFDKTRVCVHTILIHRSSGEGECINSIIFSLHIKNKEKLFNNRNQVPSITIMPIALGVSLTGRIDWIGG